MTQSSSEQLLDTPNGEQTLYFNKHAPGKNSCNHTYRWKIYQTKPPIKAAKIRNVGKYAHKHNWKHIL